MLPATLKAARRVIAGSLRAGGSALDGTAGTGRDTLFLARRVGPTGRVWSFDVQSRALEQTRLRLEAARVAARVELVGFGHETLAEHVDRVDAAMFNLGYLPGSDKRVLTRAETTLRALDAAFDKLARNGAMTVVAYPGHPGGREEAEAVEDWFESIGRRGIRSTCYRFFTRSGNAPILYALIKTRTIEDSRR